MYGTYADTLTNYYTFQPEATTNTATTITYTYATNTDAGTGADDDFREEIRRRTTYTAQPHNAFYTRSNWVFVRTDPEPFTRPRFKIDVAALLAFLIS